MHILLTTYGLLLIFVLFCAAQWRSATDMAFMDTIAIERFTESRNISIENLNEKSKDLYLKSRPKAPAAPKIVSSKVDSSKQADTNALPADDDEDNEPTEPADIPKDEPDKKISVEQGTRFLNVRDMFLGENPSITEGKGKACFTLLKNLLTAAYEGQDFFQEAKEQIPDIEERFLINLYEKAKEAQQEGPWIKTFKNLDQLHLDDEVQNELRYMAFNGNKSQHADASSDASGYFALTELVSVAKRKNTIMSLWKAPKPLLMALFQNPDVVQEVLETRREIFNEINRDKTNASLITSKEGELKLRFGVYIQGIDTQYIDFKVSKSRPPDMPSPAKKDKK